MQVGHALSTNTLLSSNVSLIPLSLPDIIWTCYMPKTFPRTPRQRVPALALLTEIQTYKGSINGAKLEISFEEAGKK